jgi:hypothetical protein
LAGHLKGKAHIIICGRNKKAADSVLASLPKPTKEFKTEPMHEFVHCDATMMSNVHAMTMDLLAHLLKINFLILSIGVVNMQGRSETEEGIDKWGPNFERIGHISREIEGRVCGYAGQMG